jgi:hypothetical protein
VFDVKAFINILQGIEIIAKYLFAIFKKGIFHELNVEYFNPVPEKAI